MANLKYFILFKCLSCKVKLIYVSWLHKNFIVCMLYTIMQLDSCRYINRLGTMADLAIIVHYSYKKPLLAIKTYTKNEFSADLLQKLPSRISPGFPVYCKPLWQQKKRKDSFPQLLVFAPTAFLFWSCILVRKIYTWLTKSVFTAFIGLSLLVSDINCFLPSKMSISKYTAEIKIPSAQKPGAYWNESLRFFCCPRRLQLTAQPGQMRLGTFYNNSTKI